MCPETKICLGLVAREVAIEVSASQVFPKAPGKNVIGWIQVFVTISLPIRCRNLPGVLALGGVS